ncbi:type II/IV secretion system protein [Candidatus Babeliales bacterium]|nr:type II/IV secretion system protein [Candidatus Babeliales bacterium]
MDINSDKNYEGVVLKAPIYNLYDKEERIRKDLRDDRIVELVDDLICRAIALHASDIHLQPMQDYMRVRFRIDGILYDQEDLNIYQQLLVISRLKVISGLDIAKKRNPQDGKLRVRIFSDKIIDLRIATFPTIYGEKMVIRILDKYKNKLLLEELGFSQKIVEGIKSIISRKQGLFLVTGPTGSGKTTTLYSILSILDSSKYNIVTMEDPVEYNLDGITQSQVNIKSGFTFSSGLRSLLRHDPDIIMIGEIRDKETAQIAVEASLTGHLVLSTLHTNDSIGAITRLIDMGVEPFLVKATLMGVLAQRLIRKLCDRCKVEKLLNNEEMILFKINKQPERSFISKGCNFCFNLGYKGRVAIGELLAVNSEILNLVTSDVSEKNLRILVSRLGIKNLFDDLLDKLEKGIISVDEFIQVAYVLNKNETGTKSSLPNLI